MTNVLMTTLHCHAGDHDWQRPSQRGRKPLNCPEHNGSESPANTGVSARRTANDELCEQALEAIDQLSEEDGRKVYYIVDQLTGADRRDDDSKMLADRLRDIIRPRRTGAWS